MLRGFFVAVSAGFIAVAAVPALAADMYDPYAQNNTGYYGASTSANNWGGIYGGVVAGFGWGNGAGLDTDGGVMGVTLGYNYQYHDLVVGAEGDLSYSGIGSRSAVGRFDQNWIGTARLRAGYAFDRFMVFGTGGFAFSTAEFKSPAFGKDDATHYGWTLGGGIEAALTEKITAKVDYLYTNLNTKNYTVGAGIRANPDVSQLRAGVNYRF